VIWLAVIGARGRVVGSNPKYTSSELAHLLQLTKPKFIFAQTDCMKPIVDASAEVELGLRHSTRILSLDNQPTSSDGAYEDWRTLLAAEKNPKTEKIFENSEFEQGRIAMYGMTSGTTGMPKAAMVSCRSVVAQASLIEDQFNARTYQVRSPALSSKAKRTHANTSQPKQLICLPIFHAFAAPVALVLPLRLGLPTYFLPRWLPSEYLQAIEKYSITDTPVCPPIIGALTDLPESDYHRLRSLRYVISAGTVLPTAVQNRFSDVLPHEAVVAQCLGTTETGWITLGGWQDKDHSGSVGRLLPNVRLKLVGDNGDVVKTEECPGEALVKTPTLFSGYLARGEATKAAFDEDGYYRTGDRVYVKGGQVYYLDRTKETLKVNGWQVSPTELESIVMQHPGIVDCAVIGTTRTTASGILETLPTAYIVRSGGVAGIGLHEQAVREFVAKRVISYKRLTGGVIFVNQIPRSAAGKILRRKLGDAEPEMRQSRPSYR
jgi:acyl-CoA synthetase (AMP-forming)/AMP-acid ligase II